jgi:hypothetical protein
MGFECFRLDIWVVEERIMNVLSRNDGDDGFQWCEIDGARV